MITTMIRRATSAMVLSGALLTMHAIPAKPGLLTMQQPDGSKVSVRLVGDEHAHLYTTPQGYPLVSANGSFFYAGLEGSKIVSSGIRYMGDAEVEKSLPKFDTKFALKNNAYKRKIAKAAKFPGLYTDAAFPLSGSPRALVILVEYSDIKMTLPNSHDYFNRMLNEPGFSDYGATGSACDYFKENSGGRFTPQFDVVGPVTLSRPREYYGANAAYGDRHPEDMIIEACQLIDDEIDFTKYDTDGDGVIDNVFVFYAGQSEAAGGGDDTIWPHSSNIALLGNYVFDGKQLDYYACSNEWQEGRPDGVGTFIHEFSHVLGLPDLYSTIDSDAFTPGAWSVLDTGPYNNNGCTPPLYSSFERTALGWLEPTELSGACSATLLPLSTGMAAVVKTSDPNEYFLIENRQQQGWDSYLPGHGMLIWHIDFDSGVWATNSVNNDPNHQRVDLIEADGSTSDSSRGGDAFPGVSDVRSFDFKAWDSNSSILPIFDINEFNGLISFRADAGSSLPAATNVLPASEVGAYSFKANWQASEGTEYILSVDGPDGPVADYNLKYVGAAASHIVTGLDPDTEYSYTLRSIVGLQMSLPSAKVDVTTASTPLTERIVEALEADEVSANGFTARWIAAEGAYEYDLRVYCKDEAGPVFDILAFDNGIDDIAEFGWSSTSSMIYNMTGMAGASAPSLRLGAKANSITSPQFSDGISSLSIWHRGSSTTDSDRILIEARCSGSWIKVDEIPVITDKGGKTTDFNSIPDDADAIRITAICSDGYVAIDDITVGHGKAVKHIAVSGFDPCVVENATSQKVGGLDSGKTYFYTVSARGFDGESLQSREIEVKTVSGISKPVLESVSINTNGLSVCINGNDSNSAVRLYDSAGRLSAYGKGNCSLSVSTPGVYILIIGNRATTDAIKVVLR